MADIDLKQSYGGKLSAPQEVCYPSFHYSGTEKLELPPTGEMTIRYKITNESKSRSGEAETHSCTVEVQAICGVKKTRAPYKRDKSAEEALDSLAEKYHGED